jgi:hypothetical protein
MCRIRNCVVAIETRLWFKRPKHRGSILGRDKRFLPYPMRDTKPPFRCATGAFPRGYISRSVKLITYLHLMLMLRMIGAKPSLPLFMASTRSALPSLPHFMASTRTALSSLPPFHGQYKACFTVTSPFHGQNKDRFTVTSPFSWPVQGLLYRHFHKRSVGVVVLD